MFQEEKDLGFAKTNTNISTADTGDHIIKRSMI